MDSYDHKMKNTDGAKAMNDFAGQVEHSEVVGTNHDTEAYEPPKVKHIEGDYSFDLNPGG